MATVCRQIAPKGLYRSAQGCGLAALPWVTIIWRQTVAKLPQRGCINQPRVAAWPLPWVTVNHVINPNGVASGEGSLYAAIVILCSYSFGIFNERPQALSAGCGNPERNARLFGRGFEEIGVFSCHRRRHGRSCTLLGPIGPDHHTSRLGEGTKTSIQHLGQTTGPHIDGVCMAGGIWCIFSQRIRHRQNTRLHSRTAGASQNTNVSGGIQGVSPQTRYEMRRAVCMGMTQSSWGWRSFWKRRIPTTPRTRRIITQDCRETTTLGQCPKHTPRRLRPTRMICTITQPRWGWGSCVGDVPRVAALPQPWAMGQNPLGIPCAVKQLTDVVRTTLPERGTK